jgi:hypothetical protein
MVKSGVIGQLRNRGTSSAALIASNRNVAPTVTAARKFKGLAARVFTVSSPLSSLKHSNAAVEAWAQTSSFGRLSLEKWRYLSVVDKALQNNVLERLN